MSPAALPPTTQLPGFPRVSGDEPTTPRKTRGLVEFSPRERG